LTIQNLEADLKLQYNTFAILREVHVTSLESVMKRSQIQNIEKNWSM